MRLPLAGLLLVLILLVLAAVVSADCETDKVATGEYANIVRESRDALEKEVAALRVRLMLAEKKLADLTNPAPTEPQK